MINWHNKILQVLEDILIYIIGTGTILLRGPKVREALKHFGRAAGLPGSHAKPYVSHTARRGKGARWFVFFSTLGH